VDTGARKRSECCACRVRMSVLRLRACAPPSVNINHSYGPMTCYPVTNVFIVSCRIIYNLLYHHHSPTRRRNNNKCSRKTDTYRFVTFHLHYYLLSSVNRGTVHTGKTYPLATSIGNRNFELDSTRHVTTTVPQNRIILRIIQIEQYYVLIIIILSMAIILASGLGDILVVFLVLFTCT